MSRKKPARSAIVATSQSVSYSGPLPPGDQLARYEQVLPGLADRVVRMAESNAEHRQELEKTVVRGNVESQARGQWFAFIISIVVVGAGSWLLVLGKTSVGLWLILGDVAALATVFVAGRSAQSKERTKRRQELERT